jgi:asparagine synthetase B (glutamine-hydrolysing)
VAGIFGFVASRALPEARTIAGRLAALMTVFPWQRAHYEEVAPGRVFLGVVLRDDAPATRARYWHREDDLSCAVDGYITNTHGDGEVARRLAAGEYAGAASTAYRKYGYEFPAQLGGQFSVVLHDAARRQVIVGNGRYGFAPLYRHSRHDNHLFASLLGPMAACGLFDPVGSAEEIASFLTFGQSFGRQTIVRECEVLDAATTLLIPLEGGEPTERRHWDFGRIGPRRVDTPLRRQVDDVCDALNAAADRIAQRGGRVVSGLSGGYDSRLVTTLAARRDPALRAWTFGSEDSRDITAARLVCRALGIDHLTYPIRPDTIPEYAALFVTTTNGAMGVNLGVGLERRQDLRERADLVLNGNAGDAILGGSMLGPRPATLKAWARYRLGRGPRAASPWLERNRTDLDAALYLNAKYGHRSRLDGLGACVAPDFTESVRAEFAAAYGQVPMEYRVEQWIFQNRVRRWTILGIQSDRPFYADDSPFYDHAMFETALAIPPALRRGHQAYVGVFKRLVPNVADIVCGNTGLPASTPGWLVTASKISRRVTDRTHPLSTGGDPDAWVRAELRDFYADLVASPTLLARPWWDGQGVRRLFEAHQRGEGNYAHELGLIAAVEIFARQWLDGASAA